MGTVVAVAETSLGARALWIVAGGLALYVLWRLVAIVPPAESTVSTWFTRTAYAVSVMIDAFLAWSAWCCVGVEVYFVIKGVRPSLHGDLELAWRRPRSA